VFLARPATITRLTTGHQFIGGLLLFGDEEHELVTGHLLHGLWIRSINLTAQPVIFSVGVDAEFYRFVGDTCRGLLGACDGF
jgi:hypothetical protein